MLYGADVFLGPNLCNDTIKEKKGGRATLNKLAAIQQSAAIAIVGGLRTSPNDILDVHANLLPFHLMVDKIRFQAALRLATLPSSHPLCKPVLQAARRFVKKHHSPLHELMYKFKLKPKLMEKIAATRQDPKWEPGVAIRIAGDKGRAKEEDSRDRSHIKVYMDGSGVEGQIGAAAILYRDGVLKRTRRMRVGSAKHHTVFEGEGIGMILGLELIREEEVAEGMIPIGIDNTAAISATHAIKPSPSHYIWDILHRRVAMVCNKHKRLDILVKWTPGHMGIEGNERADEEAKKAAREGSSPSHKLPAPLRKILPRSKSAARQEFLRKLKLAAIKLWKESPRFERIAHLGATFKHNSFTKLTNNMHHERASLLFQLRVGHVPLNAYLYKIKKSNTPICMNCHQHNETVIHYILHCTKFMEARKTMFHEAGRDARNIGKLLSMADLLPHLFWYIKVTGRFRMRDREAIT